MADFANATAVKAKTGVDALVCKGSNAAVRMFVGQVTGGASDDYSTDGVPLPAASVFGFKKIVAVLSWNGQSGYFGVPVLGSDLFPEKVKLFEAGADGAALDEVTDSASLADEVFSVVVLGY